MPTVLGRRGHSRGARVRAVDVRALARAPPPHELAWSAALPCSPSARRPCRPAPPGWDAWSFRTSTCSAASSTCRPSCLGTVYLLAGDPRRSTAAVGAAVGLPPGSAASRCWSLDRRRAGAASAGRSARPSRHSTCVPRRAGDLLRPVGAVACCRRRRRRRGRGAAAGAVDRPLPRAASPGVCPHPPAVRPGASSSPARWTRRLLRRRPAAWRGQRAHRGRHAAHQRQGALRGARRRGAGVLRRPGQRHRHRVRRVPADEHDGGATGRRPDDGRPSSPPARSTRRRPAPPRQRSARRRTLPASPCGSSSTNITFSGHL